MQSARRRIRDMGTLAGILYQGNYNAQRTARLLVLGFELADHSLGLVVEGGDDLVGVLFRVVKSQVYKALEMLTRWPLFRRARPPERPWDIIAW